jgi:zinc transporter
MTASLLFSSVHTPGLIWGYDFVDGEALPVRDVDLLNDGYRAKGFLWIHFNLADQRTLHWLGQSALLREPIRALLVSADHHQHAVWDDGMLGAVLHDIEHEFHEADPEIGHLKFALGPQLMVTARRHPVRSCERLKRRIAAGARVQDAPGALELLFSAMVETHRLIIADMDRTVQSMEDGLLRDRPPPKARDFVAMRSLMVRLHRLFSGLRTTLRLLEEDEVLPEALDATVGRFLRRVNSLDGELLTIQNQMKVLREELDLQASQRTNQNLYVLSILSALLLPATLVTGIFGMNTGGFPWASHPMGTLFATGLSIGSAGMVYLGLRVFGFLRR